jgi:hypothetical protein
MVINVNIDIDINRMQLTGAAERRLRAHALTPSAKPPYPPPLPAPPILIILYTAVLLANHIVIERTVGTIKLAPVKHLLAAITAPAAPQSHTPDVRRAPCPRVPACAVR